MVKDPPANAGDTGPIPVLGKSHVPWGNQARAPQLLKPARSRAHAPQQEKPASQKSVPRNDTDQAQVQAQLRRPSTAKSKSFFKILK